MLVEEEKILKLDQKTMSRIGDSGKKFVLEKKNKTYQASRRKYMINKL